MKPQQFLRHLIVMVLFFTLAMVHNTYAGGGGGGGGVKSASVPIPSVEILSFLQVSIAVLFILPIKRWFRLK